MNTGLNEKIKYSEYHAGYQNNPNPKYDRLLFELQDAQANLRQCQNIIPVNQYDVSKSFCIGFWVGRRNKIKRELNSTSPYIKKAISQNYQYIEKEYMFTPYIEVDYKIIDEQNRITLKDGTIKANKSYILIGIEGAHPEDKKNIKNKQINLQSETQRIFDTFINEKLIDISNDICLAIENAPLYRAKDSLINEFEDAAIETTLAYKIYTDINATFIFNHPNNLLDELNIKSIDNDITEMVANVKEVEQIEDCIINLNKIFTMEYIGKKIPNEYHNLQKLTITLNSEQLEYKSKKSFIEKRKSLIANIQPYQTTIAKVEQEDSKYSENLTPQEIIKKTSPAVVVIKTLMNSGSGFIINTNGYIVTNYHVIENARDILVELFDGRKYFAEIINKSITKDIAIIKIDANNQTFIPLGDINKVYKGETVIAIGAPMGSENNILEQTITKGIVSAMRKIKSEKNLNQEILYIQTDAAINPGNSGGPLINMKGQVIGINTQKLVGIATEGISFAIAIDEIKNLLPNN